ncbi:MAG: AraC family transcriptional regulator [Pseudomonadales bacterium]|nr:AraC family transcriptional regulator [Pseudomonadales bacterium]
MMQALAKEIDFSCNRNSLAAEQFESIRLEKSYVYSKLVFDLIQVAQTTGISRHSLLKNASLDKTAFSNPYHEVPLSSFLKLIDLLEENNLDPDIGLWAGKTFVLGLHEIRRHLSNVCDLFHEYISIAPNLVRLFGDAGRIEVCKKTAVIEWNPTLSEVNGARYLTDMAMSSIIHFIDSVCLAPVRPLKAEFTYSSPVNTAFLESVFGDNLRFGASRNRIYFDRSIAFRSTVKIIDASQEQHLSTFKQVLRSPKVNDPFLLTVKKVVARSLPGGNVNIDKIASQLCISRRTLQRRLSASSYQFIELLREVREELADVYLRENKLTITEIALMLGYSNQAAFSSAFKVWTNSTPTEYRNNSFN